MKKIIFILLLLSCFAGAFADTGYNNRVWFSQKGTLKLQFEVTPGPEELWKTTEVEEKPILGTTTRVYYHYVENMFVAVSYIIPQSKTKQLKTKFKTLVETAPTYSLKKEDYIKNLINAGTIPENEDVDLHINNLIAMGAIDIEFNGLEQLETLKSETGKGLISIYDYNEDTRVFLFENFLLDYTVVVYTCHEQDY